MQKTQFIFSIISSSGFEASVDVSFECFDIVVDTFHLPGNLDALGAMLHTLAAPDAVVGLTQLGHAAVIANEEGLAGAGVIRVVAVAGEITLGDTLVVVGEHTGDIDAIGARHAVLAVVARDGVVAHNLVGNAIEEVLLLVGEFLKRAVGAQILLEVLHIGHAAQHSEHAWE